jgi:hypothetical protein
MRSAYPHPVKDVSLVFGMACSDERWSRFLVAAENRDGFLAMKPVERRTAEAVTFNSGDTNTIAKRRKSMPLAIAFT